MAFMEPEVVHDKFYAVETNVGTELVPTDVIGIDDEV
jgi:hypothetical protein